MDQIANLVIDLGIDAAEFKNEIPRIKNLLNGAASDAERSSARMQRFMERQTQAARQTTQAASSAATAASVHAQTVEKNAQAHERMAREVEKTRQRMEALSQKMREEQAQAMALAEAQDKAAAAFYRQIDSVKQASAGLQELQRIQQQIRQARNSGGIGQQDYLALISEVTAKTRVLTQAEEEATRQKVAFIRQLKEQATRQNLSSSELLRAKAAQLGVSSAAEVYIRKMEQAGKATHSLGLKSAAARQEIGVLIGELARGNLGALRGSGITLANRAGWIDTLMSPKGMMLGGVIGGIAAAVYGLGKAWYDGQKEGEEFNRQLSLTGHYAGVTAGQLWTLSRAISGNGITQHAAAGALAQVVGSGAFRGNDIGMVARAAAQMERSVARPTLTVSNLHGMVTGMAEDLQSLVGGTVVRRKVYARFLDAVNFVNGNSDADPEQEVISRWRIEQCSELSAVSASFVLSTPTETDGAVFPGRIMLANTCTWTYRGDECGYHGPAVADEYDQPTSDITKDKCSKCLSGCKFRNNVGNFGGFLSINKLSQ